jgi:NTP pyrophosphatase (non-canonical NTP hydrolase)
VICTSWGVKVIVLNTMSRVSTNPIRSDVTLKDLQNYVWQISKDRGFDKNTPEQKFLILTEEIGELARAIREHIGLKFDSTTKWSRLADELADVQILLLGLASLLEVDMIRAVSEKEAKNLKRNWQKPTKAK